MNAFARLRRVAALTAVAAATVVSLTACAFAPTGSDAGSAPATDGALQTVTAGKLTIATGEPAFSPWVENDDPASCEGFEAAVSCAVAEKLGFAASDIVWVRSNFDSAIAPGPKDWDMNIQQFSITDERKQAVDFSSPYYTTTQAVVTTGTSPAASVTSVAELKNLPVGVMSATTSYTVAADQLGTANLSVFNSNDDAVAALQSGQVDAIVVDLPTAFYLAGAVLDDGKVVGQFPDSSAGGDELAYVLPKGSALTTPVSDAIDALRADGTLEQLQQKWLADAVDAPVLK
ncbi:ABC transporter substrate-binding protein [Microbacterium trichothecenolyticum]|uniref:Polar amino acid transport system substrate-binding protein n=1 Tax=Microbacterium trichothecenolyticum TaxID=69370 RepID=A0ABU0TYF6_MICTR|nr:ABC transporter substrate-binding protein [Microbacterium trichothecenolyticum]MDQ1123992.1 polar amino acid transport system substrate-binding protein [Microbacterium trichothecenolyticum]